ncbi:MAG: hypothetical protein GX996_09560 [Firmicutes bacterium]|nr:hypothetical protein [Bacillota bacterium]
MNIGPNLFIMGLVFFIMLVAVQAFMSTRKYKALGYVIPMLFLILAGFNYYKSLYVYNPYPTMAEGMFITLGLVGFSIAAITLVVCRLVQKYYHSK